MLKCGMAASLPPLLEIERWRALPPYVRATLAYFKGDFETALREYQRVVRVERLRTTERMAFLAQLMVLNRQPPEQYLDLFKRVVAGQFREDDGSPYAKAFAQYWWAYLTGQPDVVKWWMDAYALKPKKGWAARALELPGNPLLESQDE